MIRSVGQTIHGVECYEAWRDERRCPHEARDAVRAALEHVWSGDLAEEADAVLDQLDDLGYRVVPK